MQTEYSNGTDGLFSRNDGNVTGKSDASAFGTQEGNGEVNGNGKEESYPEFKNSNRRLDNYHLYFSSWL